MTWCHPLAWPEFSAVKICWPIATVISLAEFSAVKIYCELLSSSRLAENLAVNKNPSVEPPPFIKSIHPKQVIVVSNKAFKLPAASQTINKIPSVLQLSLFYPSSPPFFFDGEFLSQSWTPQKLPSFADQNQNITSDNEEDLYGRLLVNSHTTPSALISGRGMLFEQDRLSDDTVLRQNPGTMYQIPRRLLAIALPLLPIYQFSVQREYKKISQKMFEQLHRTSIFFKKKWFPIS